MESTDTRTLTIEIPPCLLTKNAPDPTWTTTTSMNGWQFVIPGELNIFWEGTIDLSGYARHMKTFYPSAGLIQQGPMMLEVDGGGSLTYTIISSVPISPEETLFQVSAMNGGPGFLNLNTVSAIAGGSQQDWNTVLFAESQVYVPNTNLSPNPSGIQQRLEVNQTGSLSPTATDTLYILKLVVFFGAASTATSIPASRVILPGKFGTEPDVEYMMRLKRSTELSQQV